MSHRPSHLITKLCELLVYIYRELLLEHTDDMTLMTVTHHTDEIILHETHSTKHQQKFPPQ